MNERSILVVIVVVGFFLLGFSFFANVFDIFNFLANPLFGEGLGNLCSSPENCQEFCQNNKGRCNEYCDSNPTNILCNNLFGGLDELK